MRTFTTVLLITALALVIAACGDDDASPTTTAASTSTTVASSTTVAPSTTAAPTAGDQVGPLLDLYNMTPLRTTYLIGDGTDRTEVTMSQDPTAVPPVQAVLVPDSDTKVLTIGEDTIFCNTADNTCFAVPGGVGEGLTAGLLGPFAGGLFAAGQLEGIPGATMTGETATVAGRDGVCFTFTPPAGAGFDTDLIRQCLDSEFGFTLLIQAQEAGAPTITTVMELTEFGQPLPDDFVPSGPVTTTP